MTQRQEVALNNLPNKLLVDLEIVVDENVS